jgi:hypothetical protein
MIEKGFGTLGFDFERTFFFGFFLNKNDGTTSMVLKDHSHLMLIQL